MRNALVALIAVVTLTYACGSGSSTPSLSFADDSGGATETGADPGMIDTTIADTTVRQQDTAQGHDSVSSDTPSDAACVPDCVNHECGQNGCGGSCGECVDGKFCVKIKGGAICASNLCPPGVVSCRNGRATRCDEKGTGWTVIDDCVAKGLSCDDGNCFVACDSDACSPGTACMMKDGKQALCGGVIDCDTGPDGQGLGNPVPIGEMFADEGVMFYTSDPGFGVFTNWWELDSDSGGQSCATLDQFNNPWTGEIYVRFVVPTPSGYEQGATDRVSFFIGQTWPGGLIAALYGPASQPGSTGSSPFKQIATDSNGTDFISHEGQPVGWVRITFGSDPDFTIDDLSYGPVHQ